MVSLPRQIEHTLEQYRDYQLPDNYQDFDNIVCVGMGGSALGALVVKSLFQESLRVPFEIVNNYTLPGYVGSRTLVMASSYSGTTEEVLTAANQAYVKGARLISISAGGTLAEMAKESNWPHLHLDVRYNPSNQPRMAIGYAVFAQIIIFERLGLIDLADDTISQAIAFLKTKQSEYEITNVQNNLPLSLAEKIAPHHLMLISSDHLTGPAHVFNNQINENAKQITSELKLPELNHHFLEALKFPENAAQNHFFLLFDSPAYHPLNRKRLNITKDILTQLKYPHEVVIIDAKDKLTQAFQLIQLGAFTNLYLALLNGIDPASIPWVDYFKQQLSES